MRLLAARWELCLCVGYGVHGRLCTLGNSEFLGAHVGLDFLALMAAGPRGRCSRWRFAGAASRTGRAAGLAAFTPPPNAMRCAPPLGSSGPCRARGPYALAPPGALRCRAAHAFTPDGRTFTRDPTASGGRCSFVYFRRDAGLVGVGVTPCTGAWRCRAGDKRCLLG